MGKFFTSVLTSELQKMKTIFYPNSGSRNVDSKTDNKKTLRCFDDLYLTETCEFIGRKETLVETSSPTMVNCMTKIMMTSQLLIKKKPQHFVHEK